jgi:predicted methyltransferase
MRQDYRSSAERANSVIHALSHIERSPVLTNLDQCPATIETVVRRVNLLDRFLRDGECERLLLLGDDDLLSVGLVAANPQRHVTVADLDPAVLETISLATQGIVATVEADFRLGLPSNLLSSFDVVFTDPPYTLAGQLLFASCALKALRSLHSGHVLICGSDLYLKTTDHAVIDSCFRAAGFIEYWFEKDFNEYTAPADVRADMVEAGIPTSETFFSSVRWFKRITNKGIPAIPLSINNNIYDYGANDGAS